ncbi:MAG TPA: RNA-binding S4 domain-containing protein [Bacteroidales bacterium]|nr:RNA-binding S4 domain-containing protein [Bacteroidales bacterium]HQI71184.1 RNA-binding S4 domain-containing protein [Bacteroidales bacterium]
MEEAKIRIDKWLWAVRIYKTRSLATEACRNGKVYVGDQAIKASREVKINDIIYIHQHQITKSVKVIALLEKRVSAKLVEQFMEDLTPASEYEKVETIKAVSFVYRPKGAGRPTKKERRDIEKYK